MRTVCENNQCAGCMACVDICPTGAVSIIDNLKSYNAIIDENKCMNCNTCHKMCQKNNPVKCENTIQWWQGWNENEAEREKSSSGGLATAIASSFINNGGIVWACTFEQGEFRFECAEHQKELSRFVGSKYVKSNPIGVYKKIKEALKSGEKVLFIGLPCQVGALKKYIGEILGENLYTIDLICHGTPSPQLLEIFLNQYNKSLNNIQKISFRIKAKFMIYADGKGIITKGVSDRYSIAFLNSLIYTDNCYNCYYAQKKRISDLTIGDSWGSEIKIQEKKKGVSLILCQTLKGIELVKNSDVHLENVDINMAIKNNHQLEHPSFEPRGRRNFFKNIDKINFNLLVLKNFPKVCIKQDIKQMLINLNIIKSK